MGSPGSREAVLAAQNNIKQHLQYCNEHKSSGPGAVPSTSPTWTHEIDNGNHTDLIVQFHDRLEFRGAANAMMRLIHVHGIEELRRVGIIGQGSVAHMREMILAAGVYNIPVHSEDPSASSLDNTEPTSPLDLRRLEINAQSDPTPEHSTKPRPIPFPSNEDIEAVQGQGTVAFELESELKTRDSQHMNKSRPDIVISDLDSGITLSGICMAFAGTGTHVFGAAPQDGFWEYAWSLHSPGATPSQDEQAYRYWAGTKHPMSAIPWTTFNKPGYLSGVFEVNHEQVNAARILARDNYHLNLQSDEAVPLAVALYNEEFQKFASKGTKKGRKRVVGIILRSRKDYH